MNRPNREENDLVQPIESDVPNDTRQGRLQASLMHPQEPYTSSSMNLNVNINYESRPPIGQPLSRESDIKLNSDPKISDDSRYSSETDHRESRDKRSNKESRNSEAHDILMQLQLEERIRDAARSMIAELELEPKKTVASAEWQQRKKLQHQIDNSNRIIQELNEELRILSIQEHAAEEEVSSADEDAMNTLNTISVFQDESTISAIEDDNIPSLSSPMGLVLTSNSAASSIVDISDSKTADDDKPVSPQTATSLCISHVSKLLEVLQSNTKPGEAEFIVNRLEDSLSMRDLKDKNMNEQEHELHVQSLYTRLPWDKVIESIKPFLLSQDMPTFCLGLRLSRIFMFNSKSIQLCNSSLSLDLILISALGSDMRDDHNNCRFHVVQVIRQMITAGSSKVCEISRGVCCAMVSAAEQSDDKIRFLCIETLAELLVLDPQKAFQAGAVKILLNTMTEVKNTNYGNLDEQINYCLSLCMAFISASDAPDLRKKYLRDGKDFISVLTAFTDIQLYTANSSYNFNMTSTNLSQSKDTTTNSTLSICAAVMKLLLRTWVGLNCFDIQLLVECMTLPLANVQNTLIDVVDCVLVVNNEPKTPNNMSSHNSAVIPNQFTALLLHILHKYGLVDQLEQLQTNGENLEVKQKARNLMSKVLVLNASLMPQPQILEHYSKSTRLLTKSLETVLPYGLPTTSVAFLDSEQKTYYDSTYFEPSMDAFVRFSKEIDDNSFKKLLNSTHVLDTKSFTQWNWDALMELIQGPLKSSKRIEETTRNSKFMKRLLSFFRPFKYRFSYLTALPENRKYAEVGKELMCTFLETEEGIGYLSGNKLFRQIAECLAQLDPLSGIVSTDPLLSVKRFRATLCSAYLEMIGVLSRSETGQQFLAQMRIFNMFYRLCDINREDIVRSIICTLDYRLEGHPRLILAKAMSANNSSTRLYATEFVGYKLAIADSQFWLIDLLMEQLYDSEFAVVKAASQALYNMCIASVDNLDYFISLRPSLKHLKEHKEPLMTLFMTRSKGFQLLMVELNDEDMKQWAPECLHTYVSKMESYLENLEMKRFSTLENDQDRKSSIEPFSFPFYTRPSRRNAKDNIYPPSHIYGELSSSDEGCAFLKSNGNLGGLCLLIKDAAKCIEKEPAKVWSPDEQIELKAALWAVGHVGSQSRGAKLLNIDVVESICLIAKNVLMYSLKGTAYNSLALFAKSQSGAEFVHQCNWSIVYDSFMMPQGVAIPPESYFDKFVKPQKLMISMEFPLTIDSSRAHTKDSTSSSRKGIDLSLEMPRENTSSSSTQVHTPLNAVSEISFDFEEPNRETKNSSGKESLLLSVSQLTSSVLSQSASKNLLALRNSNPSLFQSGEVLREVLEIFSSGHYKQAIRRFVFKLFETKYILEKLYKRRR